MTNTPPTPKKPSPEALEAARQMLQIWVDADIPIYAGSSLVMHQDIALALDRFAATLVEAERERALAATRAVRDSETVIGRGYSACWENACAEIEKIIRGERP